MPKGSLSLVVAAFTAFAAFTPVVTAAPIITTPVIATPIIISAATVVATVIATPIIISAATIVATPASAAAAPATLASAASTLTASASTAQARIAVAVATFWGVVITTAVRAAEQPQDPVRHIAVIVHLVVGLLAFLGEGLVTHDEKVRQGGQKRACDDSGNSLHVHFARIHRGSDRKSHRRARRGQNAILGGGS